MEWLNRGRLSMWVQEERGRTRISCQSVVVETRDRSLSRLLLLTCYEGHTIRSVGLQNPNKRHTSGTAHSSPLEPGSPTNKQEGEELSQGSHSLSLKKESYFHPWAILCGIQHSRNCHGVSSIAVIFNLWYKYKYRYRYWYWYWYVTGLQTGMHRLLFFMKIWFLNHNTPLNRTILMPQSVCTTENHREMRDYDERYNQMMPSHLSVRKWGRSLFHKSRLRGHIITGTPGGSCWKHWYLKPLLHW